MKHICLAFLVISFTGAWASSKTIYYNIEDFGAVGDGKTINTVAINRAIDEAAKHGGGTVFFPAGQFVSFTIHLKSNISLYLDQGAVLIGGTPENGIGYDAHDPKPPYHMYQDFGHTNWRNSLIWGEGLQNISILGQGLIWGKGLRSHSKYTDPKGSGVKAIALKLCRNVNIRDISILHGGHLAISTTGVDNLTIDNVKADCDRGAFDIDCCKNVKVSNCTVSSPDDGICLKSSFGLGYARATENVAITNCQMSNYDEGTLLDGTLGKTFRDDQPDAEWCITGRLKLGTESNGGFKNIVVSNCVFDRSRGFVIETVDGGDLEDIAITNITMRDITDLPFFIRLGARMRNPDSLPIGKCRRIILSNIVAYNVGHDMKDNRFRLCGMIMGIPGHYVEDVELSNIKIYFAGGGTREMVDLDVPENEKTYPDPYRWKTMPAYGLYIRHAKNIKVHNVDIRYENQEYRPAFVLDDVEGATFRQIDAQKATDAPYFMLRNVKDFTLNQAKGMKDVVFENANNEMIR